MKLNIYESATITLSAFNMLSSIDNSNLEVDNIVIVPDKLSLITEKMLLDIFPQGSLFNVRVKTLSSLSVELMQKLGIEGDLVSSGESLLLTMQAIENVKKDFLTFRKNNINFCYEISKLISQFKSSCVKAEELNQKADGIVGSKYHDLALIYSEYQRLLMGKLDANERMSLLKKKLEESQILSNTKFYFAHFDSFTKEAFGLIRCLIEKAKEVNISLATAVSIGNEYIYEKDIQHKLKNMLSQLGGEINVFTASPQLSKEKDAIIKGVFSYQKQKCANDGFYNLYSANTLSQEVESVAKHIRYSVFKGRRYKDFQIALSDTAKYGPQIEMIFDRYNIPYYLDSSVTADKTILANFILSVFQTYISGYGNENLIDLFANVLVGEKELIEICETFDVEGKARFKKYIDKKSELSAIFDQLEGCSNAQQFAAVVEKLCELSREKYHAVLSKLEEDGNLKEKNINAQIEEIIEESTALINKYSSTQIDAGEYLKRLKLILSFKQVSTVPTYVDAVMIGDSQSGFENKPILYILGGENLPISSGDNGLLSDEELKLNGLGEIEPTIRMINRRNRFKFFNLLSLADDMLMIFYQVKNEEGKKNELPTYIKNLNTIFSQDSIASSNVFFNEHPFSEEIQLLSFVEEIPQDNEWSDDKTQIKNAEKLIFQDGKVKVTQLESYFGCPFKHYATYGLKLKEKNRKFDQRDLGTLCHKMAELFIKSFMKNGIFADVKSFVDKNITKVLEDEGVKERVDVLEESNSLIGFLKKQMISLLNNIVKETQKSKFRPKYTEFKFDNLTFCNNKLKLIGKADRIDEYGDYLRVVDYKTGKTGNLLKQLYFGEKLQLFLYQKIASEKFNKKEGGVFYFNAKFNFTKGEEEEFILKGLVDADEEIVNAVDSDIKELGRSSITQIYTDSKGVKGSAISPIKVKELCDYAYQVAEKCVEEICDGYVAPSPTIEACEYCPYSALCGHEEAFGRRKNNSECKF